MILTILTALTLHAAEPYKVAIIDSGFAPLPYSTAGLKLCKTGHYDYNSATPSVGLDVMGHGAYVADIINSSAQTDNMCLIIYKVFGPGVFDPTYAIKDSLARAIKAGANAINMSLYYNKYLYPAYKLLLEAQQRGVVMYVSAGNNGKNLNLMCNKYPVCYKGLEKSMKVIGAMDKYKRRAFYSNYGARIDIYEFGETDNGALGTSFAAPRALGNYIRSLKWDERK